MRVSASPALALQAHTTALGEHTLYIARAEEGIQGEGFLVIPKKEYSGLDPGDRKAGDKKCLDCGWFFKK